MASLARPSAAQEWFIVGRWEEYEGEGRANLLRLVAVTAFYAVELLNYYGLRLGTPEIPAGDVGRPFHLAVTMLALIWTVLCLGIFLCRRQHFFPAGLKYISTGCDIVLLTAVLGLADGPKSPLLVLAALLDVDLFPWLAARKSPDEHARAPWASTIVADRLCGFRSDRIIRNGRLDLAMGTAVRNRSGQYATPAALADDIVAFCWDYWKRERRPVRFLEPCSGTGSFFSSLRRGFPAELIESALACELDEEHAAVARSLWRDAGLHVKNADFLDQTAPAKKYNLLITNPPYVRHHHLGQARKEDLQALVRERLHLRISGLAGLYCYFLLLADAWVDDGGLSVWLIPSEFMDVNYGAAVKEYLTRRVRLLRIHRFSPTDVQFDDALVSSAMVVFEKAPPADQQIAFTLGGSLRSPAQRVNVPHGHLLPAEKWTKYANTRGGRFVIGRPSPSADSRILFGDLFTIKRGLATGNNDFFILPRAKARELGIPDQFLRPILPSPRCISNPVIEADDTGYPLGIPQLALIDCRLPEAAVEKRFPRFWQYLLSGIAAGVPETYLTSRRTPWYSQEDRPPPPFLCTYMGRATNGRKPFRFLRNKSQATAHNVYLLLYPTGALKAALEREPGLYQKVFEGLQALDTDAMKGDGRVYGGGLFKLEPRELGSVAAGFVGEAIGSKRCALSRQESLFESI